MNNEQKKQVQGIVYFAMQAPCNMTASEAMELAGEFFDLSIRQVQYCLTNGWTMEIGEQIKQAKSRAQSGKYEVLVVKRQQFNDEVQLSTGENQRGALR